MRFSPGTLAVLEATFTNPLGQPVDPDEIYVDLFDLDGVKVVSQGVPERLSLGTYKYAFALPADAAEGLWRVEWSAEIGVLSAFGMESFEVASAGEIVPTEGVQQERLRSRLGEVSRLPLSSEGSDTMFSTAEINGILSYAEGDLDTATLEGWKRKVAILAHLVDVAESGSDRLLSQRFRQAKAMLDFWAARIAEVEGARSGYIAVLGSVVNLRGTGRDPSPGTPFSGYAENIRAYPTHRLLIPAIMG